MKNTFIILLITSIIAATSCTHTKAISETKSTANFLSFYRGSCYGECPSYKITIKKNGDFEYIGRMHVKNIGTFKGKLSESQTQEFFNKVKRLDWKSFPEEYPIDNVDFPSFKFEYANGKNIKNVKGNTNASKDLIALGLYIDELVKSLSMEILKK